MNLQQQEQNTQRPTQGDGKGQTVGYVRVSSADQNEARQLDAIGNVDRLFSEKVSGKDTNRPLLKEMLDYVREGDVVKVKSPDRLARSTTDLLNLIKTLDGKGVSVRFIDEPQLNTGTPESTFMLTVLGAVAELERATIRERQAEGIALAKQRGVYRRKRTHKLDAERIGQARTWIAASIPKAEAARRLGVSRPTLYEALKQREKNTEANP
ncbi:recombinase family protein [Bifidobacterium sp. ESL0745]|uniref:recombinase family protein n=1 Tax=Bifidobacterium sp. ESL0745 TaxID=2983226 RepID=UPI0023F9C20E|nr:recombinase family protein [Bifidobacterium sp. ESL0745]MDF7666126.1 recombinase family protein [Bifidobacterium sp. ESL0745]